MKKAEYLFLGFGISFLLFQGFHLWEHGVCEEIHTGKFENVLSIEHIENVDEMQQTPKELYFFTSKGKYKFDGETVEHITNY